MKKRSLEQGRGIIIEALNISKIEEMDKTELMINLTHFLDPDEYDENINVLQNEKIKRKQIRELRREMFDMMPWEEEQKKR